MLAAAKLRPVSETKGLFHPIGETMTLSCRHVGLLVALPMALAAQEVASDSSPHTQRFISVEPGVRLEALDWGGTGRPIVLLAGRGNTAHVFDDFARKLTSEFHVYGVTRRGFGNSTATTSGFLADSLGDDVLAVVDSLGLRRPILIGHSIAGQELSSVGSRHPDKVAGLVYLDAGYQYAFYDSAIGPAQVLFRETQRKLARLTDPALALTVRERDALLRELIQRLPLVERDLRLYLRDIEAIADKSRVLPAADSNPVNRSLALGQQTYTSIHPPVLAIFALPRERPPAFARDSALGARFDSANVANLSPQITAFGRGIPSSKVVRIPHANHYVFRSHEAEVLREIRLFIAGLPSSAGVAEAEPEACKRKEAAATTYVVDDMPATCRSALALSPSRIASVDVLKGPAAAQYSPTAVGSVVKIQTKRDP